MKLCTYCNKPLINEHNSAKTHTGYCRDKQRRIVNRESKRKWRVKNTVKPIDQTAKPKGTQVTHCVMCCTLIEDRQHNAITCCDECADKRRQSINRKANTKYRARQRNGNEYNKTGPLPVRPARTNQSAVVNTWNALHSMTFYQRPDAIRRIRTNRRGVVAELLSCPDDVNPRHISLHCCVEGRWQIRYKGKAISDQQRNQWSHRHQSIDYRILNASVAGVG